MAGKPQGITPRRLAVLRAVCACEEDGRLATTSRVMAHLGQFGLEIGFASSFSVLASALLERGYLRLVEGGGNRGSGERIWALTNAGREELGIAPKALRVLESAVAASAPAGIGEVATRTIAGLEEIFAFDPERDLLVPVKGDSMDEMGILDGDRILVRVLPDGETPPDGAVVVAWVDMGQGNEWTVKQFLDARYGSFWLVPCSSNPAHAPMWVSPIPLDELNPELFEEGERLHGAIHLCPECAGVCWVWTGGLLRPPRGE